MAHAIINSRERVDDGVDFGVSGGWLGAIGECVIVANAPGGWGQYGNFVAYKLTEPGPLEGMQVYYAEGVTSGRRVGDRLGPGNGVCDLIPYWHSGIEIGWYSGVPWDSWAVVYGGGHHRTEHTSTRAGLQFNDLLGKLGAPQGIPGTDVMGTAPGIDISQIRPGVGTPSPVVSLDTGATAAELDPSKDIRDVADQWSIHGSRTYNHANVIDDLFRHTSYIDQRGPR